MLDVDMKAVSIGRLRLASMYGFNGHFRIDEQSWHENQIHLITVMTKIPPLRG
jgi:hypothetical protein